MARRRAKKRKFRGQLCVYCGTNQATSIDHLPPKNLFTRKLWASLPQVPSCTSCHSGESIHDEYFRQMIIMRADTADHPGAKSAWAVVMKSLEREDKRRFREATLRNLELREIRTPAGIVLGNRPTYNVSQKRLLRALLHKGGKETRRWMRHNSHPGGGDPKDAPCARLGATAGKYSTHSDRGRDLLVPVQILRRRPGYIRVAPDVLQCHSLSLHHGIERSQPQARTTTQRRRIAARDSAATRLMDRMRPARADQPRGVQSAAASNRATSLLSSSVLFAR
jgi:hypothetical protein